MKNPKFSEVKGLWQADGSLRDVYFLETTLEDWEAFTQLMGSFPTSYAFNGDAAPIPSAKEIFSNRDGGHLLSVSIGSVVVNCHFFITEEIELDIDPRQIKGPFEHEAVLRFIETVASHLNKMAYLTPENCPEIPFLKYEPISRSWVSHG